MAEQADMTEDAAPDPQIIAPEAGKPLSKSEAVDSIADLLGPDPETDTESKTAKEDEDQASKDPLGDDDEDDQDESITSRAWRARRLRTSSGRRPISSATLLSDSRKA